MSAFQLLYIHKHLRILIKECYLKSLERTPDKFFNSLLLYTHFINFSTLFVYFKNLEQSTLKIVFKNAIDEVNLSKIIN